MNIKHALSSLLICAAINPLVAGNFTIKHPNGYVNKGLKVSWDDHVVNLSTQKRTPYPGIVLNSQGESNIQITIFVMNYKGPGRYPLKGTRDIYNDASKESNVFYSNLGLLVVDPANNGDCWVEITEDKAGEISGKYHVNVAYPIGKDPRMELSGEFTQLTKFAQ